MADIAEFGDSTGSKRMKEDKDNMAVTHIAKEMENTRKSTRLRQQSKFEKRMSLFVSQARRADKRRVSSESSSDEHEEVIPEKIPKKEVKVRGPKVAALAGIKLNPKAKEKPKVIVVKKPVFVEEDNEVGEVEEPKDESFNLAMLNLRRVGDDEPPPKKDKEPIQLNRRGMPQRIRKKNRLFFDDNVVTPPMMRQRQKRETPVKVKEEKKQQAPKPKPREKEKKEEAEPPKAIPLVDDTKEGNIVRQRIGMTLRNLLKLPKAQRWVFYEWFYSNIDRVLFFGSNDFLMCMKENFVNLKTTLLRRKEWCVLRRLLGKPRRCSQAFFREERRTLEKRRNTIRAIQQRKLRDLSMCKDIPDRIPLHLSVNSRVTARLRKPQAGLFTGKVDAVDTSNHTYRITFDRPGLGTHSIPDYEVLLDGEPDVMSISSLAKRYYSSKYTNRSGRPSLPEVKLDLQRTWADNITAKFPKAFFEMIVRICKILKEKRHKVETLKTFNTDAEKIVSLGHEYPSGFQRTYASLVLDLESLNISLERFLTTVQKYCHELAPEASIAAMLAPSYLREKSLTEAKNMVNNFFNNKAQLKNEKLVSLVIELVALMIQVQTLSEAKHSAHELQVLKQSIAKIKTMISPKNQLVFQNSVEVHIQYIESSLGQKANPLIATPPSPSK